MCCRFDLKSFHSATLQLPHDFKLQQLCIDSCDFDVCNTFMENISSHGDLVHILLHVKFVTAQGVATLVKNSPKLLTLCLFARQPICTVEGEKVDWQNFEDSFIKELSHRKLLLWVCTRWYKNLQYDSVHTYILMTLLSTSVDF